MSPTDLLPNNVLVRLTTPRRLFLILLVLGFLTRVGYGVLRYRTNLTSLSGITFIDAWDSDALHHVLIAKALLSGKGYTVDDSPLPSRRSVRHAGEEALFKAPLYEFFLAGVFAISGFSFKLFFPLQAVFGGALSGLMGLICWKVFHDPLAAWFAGIAAAGHPILVNSASQPYNENLFFFLFAAALWAFLQWVQTNTLGWAVLCGAMIGLCTLTRENGLVLLMAMGAVTVLAAPGVPRAWTGYGLIIILTIAVVSPWTWRNYHRFGTFIPVASILGEDLAEGNNACVASEGMLVPFWAEGPCPWVEQQREALRQNEILDRRLPPVVLRDRLSRAVALTFIEQHPVSYAKLVFRRFWTTLLPYDPRGNQRGPERIVLTFYWLLVFPAGFAGIARALKHLEPGRLLLLALLGLNLASIAAVLYWSDLRFRVGIDLILACFAGWFYARKLGRSAIFPPLNANSRPPNSLQY